MVIHRYFADRLLLILIAIIFGAIVVSIPLLGYLSRTMVPFWVIGCFYFLISSWFSLQDIQKHKRRMLSITALFMLQAAMMACGLGLVRFFGISWPDHGGAWIALPIIYALIFATFFAFEAIQKVIQK